MAQRTGEGEGGGHLLAALGWALPRPPSVGPHGSPDGCAPCNLPGLCPTHPGIGGEAALSAPRRPTFLLVAGVGGKVGMARAALFRP